jgi:tRNA-splicing ligase RtcB
MQYIQTKNKPIKAWIEGVELEDSALAQLMNCAQMPFIFHHVAVMPDAHWGMGATVGSVIATKGAIIPAAVGVDIGCGMMALQTDLAADELPGNLHELRTFIEALVPHGRTDNGGDNDRGAWGEAPERIAAAAGAFYDDFLGLKETHVKALSRAGFKTLIRQLGTLGTGNHFIEVCRDEADRVWLLLHSGSRGFGNKIGTYFIECAKKLAQDGMYDSWLPDKDLAYLPETSPLFNDYVKAVEIAQHYASVNRVLMMDAVRTALRSFVGFEFNVTQAINCHHNYIARENHFGQNVIVTRKGAIRARIGDLGIIPGSMGASSYIVRGKGNADSFTSCSHGAGRRMSRGAAQRLFSVDSLAEQTIGIECRKDAGVLDEAPGAYKSIEAVMAAQEELISIEYALQQLVNVKG